MKFDVVRANNSLTCVKAGFSRSCDTDGMKEKPLIEAGAQKILALAGETKFAENGIVSRTVFRSPNCRVVLFGFAATLTPYSTVQLGVRVTVSEALLGLAWLGALAA